MNQLYRTAVRRLANAAALCRNYHHNIQAIPREATGRRVSSRQRTGGLIPAIVSTQSHPSSPTRDYSRVHLLTTETKQIQSLLKKVGPDFFCSTTFNLQIRAGSGSSVLLHSGTVLPIQIHRDADTGKVLNLIFAWADEGSHLEVKVPLVIKGADSCPGLQKGGHLYTIRKKLKYLCPVESIPQKIEVDISNLDIGDQILIEDIQVDPSLKLLRLTNTDPVCKILAFEGEKTKPLRKSVVSEEEKAKPVET